MMAGQQIPDEQMKADQASIGTGLWLVNGGHRGRPRQETQRRIADHAGTGTALWPETYAQETLIPEHQRRPSLRLTRTLPSIRNWTTNRIALEGRGRFEARPRRRRFRGVGEAVFNRSGKARTRAATSAGSVVGRWSLNLIRPRSLCSRDKSATSSRASLAIT